MPSCDSSELFEKVAQAADGPVDFLDGIVVQSSQSQRAGRFEISRKRKWKSVVIARP